MDEELVSKILKWIERECQHDDFYLKWRHLINDDRIKKWLISPFKEILNFFITRSVSKRNLATCILTLKLNNMYDGAMNPETELRIKDFLIKQRYQILLKYGETMKACQTEKNHIEEIMVKIQKIQSSIKDDNSQRKMNIHKRITLSSFKDLIKSREKKIESIYLNIDDMFMSAPNALTPIDLPLEFEEYDWNIQEVNDEYSHNSREFKLFQIFDKTLGKLNKITPEFENNASVYCKNFYCELNLAYNKRLLLLSQIDELCKHKSLLIQNKIENENQLSVKYLNKLCELKEMEFILKNLQDRANKTKDKSTTNFHKMHLEYARVQTVIQSLRQAFIDYIHIADEKNEQYKLKLENVQNIKDGILNRNNEILMTLQSLKSAFPLTIDVSSLLNTKPTIRFKDFYEIYGHRFPKEYRFTCSETRIVSDIRIHSLKNYIRKIQLGLSGRHISGNILKETFNLVENIRLIDALKILSNIKNDLKINNYCEKISYIITEIDNMYKVLIELKNEMEIWWNEPAFKLLN